MPDAYGALLLLNPPGFDCSTAASELNGAARLRCTLSGGQSSAAYENGMPALVLAAVGAATAGPNSDALVMPTALPTSDAVPVHGSPEKSDAGVKVPLYVDPYSCRSPTTRLVNGIAA